MEVAVLLNVDLLISAFLLILGLLLLIKGADFLIEASVKIAQHFGISELIIGITLVAIGTSLPELAISSFASLEGHAEISISNIVGSCIFNIFVIVGLIGISIRYRMKEKKILDRDAIWCMLAALWLTLMCYSGEITQAHGLVLLLAYFAYMSYIYLDIKAGKGIKVKVLERKHIIYLIVSIFALYAGGRLTVDHAANIASIMGISEWVIGATIISLGTSLPEAATSLMAIKRKKYELSLGNIIGSNVSNVFIVVGIAAMLNPLVIDFTKFALSFMFLILSSVFITVVLIRGTFHRKTAMIALTLYALFIAVVLFAP